MQRRKGKNILKKGNQKRLQLHILHLSAFTFYTNRTSHNMFLPADILHMGAIRESPLQYYLFKIDSAVQRFGDSAKESS